MKKATLFLVLILAMSLLQTACAPDSPLAAVDAVNLGDYQRAEKALRANTSSLVSNAIQALFWQDDGSLIYRQSSVDGLQFIHVDPLDLTTELLLDSSRVLEQLNEFSEDELEAKDLNLNQLELLANGSELKFRFDGEQYILDLNSYSVSVLEDNLDRSEYLSPNGNSAAFIDENNLWLRDILSNQITQLTFDGEQDYGYATNNAGWVRSDRPVLLWSPDSSKIATFRHDGRNVREMYLYNTQVGHSELDAWKYPLAGDENIFQIERVVIHLDPEPRLVKLNMPPDPHRSTISDHIAGRGGVLLDAEWSEDSAQLAFVSSSRDHKVAQLRIADPNSGAVRTVFREGSETYYESGSRSVNWRVLHGSSEFLWFSEQDNWGHLYLHDLDSGVLKHQVTSGNWTVQQVQYVDSQNRLIYFLGSNLESGDPYYQYLYRINMDGTGLVNLTPELANHSINWSEDHKVFTDIYSTPVTPPVAVLRDTEGQRLIELAQSDIAELLASGWVAPQPFTVKARDQLTDLYGLMYKPSNFDAGNSYPILNYLYPGPQSGSVGGRSFSPSRGDKQALAELGFIVVEVDAMGTPGRSKSFHDAYYGDMGDNGLPDQVAMIRQLAAQNPWMDLDRVGIWGHSGGGFASTAGILRYPDFYKVAVSGAGNHDNRNYEDDWAEKWQGLLVTYPETNPVAVGNETEQVALTNYDNQANQLLVENLKGKLLLAHGLMDTNVPPTSTLLVVDALIKADKDFDMVMLPNAGHGFGNSRFFMKKRWDYFVRHLKGVEPPADFVFAENIR
jgi:dipeptidyl aminopeptidase/acylaminoacyl peptidase